MRVFPEELLAMNLTLPAQYEKDSVRRAFVEQALHGSASCGVQSATIVTHVPYANGAALATFHFSIEGRPPAQRGELATASLSRQARTISPP